MKTINKYVNNKSYILEDGESAEPAGVPVNTTDQVAPYTKRVGERPAKRRKKVMKKNKDWQ